MQVEAGLRHVWLAGQIDELEREFIDRMDHLGKTMDALAQELVTTRQQMAANTTRMLVAITTASITLLISVIAWVATVVIKP